MHLHRPAEKAQEEHGLVARLAPASAETTRIKPGQYCGQLSGSVMYANPSSADTGKRCSSVIRIGASWAIGDHDASDALVIPRLPSSLSDRWGVRERVDCQQCLEQGKWIGHPVSGGRRVPRARKLSDPDPAWPEQYAEQAARIETALAALEPIVEHIGSTSVPLRGKPILDVQIVVAEDDVAGAVAALEGLGYAHHGDGAVPGREYLTWRPSAGPLVNVHVFGARSSLPADNRMIRDYLRAHPERAEEYARTKQRAIDQGHVDLRTYSHAKADHVAAIKEAAYDWTRHQQS